MISYRWCDERDEDKLIDFINLIFSQTNCPHDFKRLIPKVYAHSGFGRLHAVAEDENGRVCATTAMLPFTLRMGKNTELRGGFIGSVSVHREHRGEGRMKQLMQMLLQKAS